MITLITLKNIIMKVYRYITLILFILSISIQSFSQDCGPLPPCDGSSGEVPGDINTPGANCCTNVTVPFDGGISLLIAAGVGIGVMRKRKK